MSKVFFVSALIFLAIFWLEGIFPYFKERAGRFRHAFPNAAIALADAAINLAFFFFAAVKIIQWASENSFGAFRLVSLPLWGKLLVSFVTLDLWMYAWHRANHRLKPLWLLHRAHHNDISMDSTTALRFHPLEIVLSSLFNLGVYAVLGLDVLQLAVYNAVFQPVIFFHHSNIALPEKWDRMLRAVVVTPNMHRVHHSIEPGETNSNYSSVFSFWDRLFATFRKREDTLSITYGLKILRERKWQGLWGFLSVPFQKIGT